MDDSILTGPRDILFHIAARLDDDSLLKLLYPELWDVVRSLLSNDRFWYERTMYLTSRQLQERVSVDWKRIYYATLYSTHLSYLPATLVRIELGGSIEDRTCTWEDVSDPDVLRHLIDSGSLTVSYPGILISIKQAVSRPSLPLLDLLIGLGTLTTEGILIDRALELAATYGVSAAMEHLLEKFEYSEDGLRSALDMAISAANLDVVELLLPRVKTHPDWKQVLHDAIIRRQAEFMRYVLTLTDPITVCNRTLMTALCQSDVATLSVLLDDERIDPSSDLSGVLSCMSEPQILPRVLEATSLNPHLDEPPIREDAMRVDAIVRHRLVRVERIGIPTLRLILYHLSPLIVDRVRGYILAESLSGIRSREQIGRALERGDANSLLLRFILIKRPNPDELIDWMLSQRSETFVTAAQSVVSGTLSVSSDVIPVRALLLLLLYPTLTLGELLSEMREEGIALSDLARSARLAGLYLGEQRLTALG